MKSAITISLVPETKGGPFVFWDGLADGFARAAKLGFDAVEIFPSSSEELDAREIKKLCAEHNLKVGAIGTGAGWVKHKLRLTDPDATVRRRAQQFIGAIIDFASSFGAPAILGSMQGRYEGSVTREQALAWLAEALEQLGPRAHAARVPFLYEFLNRYETNLFNRVADSLEFLKTLRTQNVKLLCDLFHMNIEESDVAAALRLAGPKVGHVHFADSNRRAIGMGHTDMKPVMAALRDIGYSGYLSAEVFALPDSQAAAERTINSFRALTADG
ncbi:MAG: sugar phosphate isomerase [Opitutia bacterium]|nr:MAG: sugar phosphate isomerase [Opitutae bacterium]